MVRDVFRLAKENAPAIIFIDEIDAIATARFDAQTGADREVQRILMELLNQVTHRCHLYTLLTGSEQFSSPPYHRATQLTKSSQEVTVCQSFKTATCHDYWSLNWRKLNSVLWWLAIRHRCGQTG